MRASFNMRSAVILTSALCLSACTPPSPPKAPPAAPQTDALAARVTALEEKLDYLHKTVSQNSVDIFVLKSRHQEAEIDPSDPKFARVDTDVGSFAIAVTDVSPFGDGVKLKVDLGNLTSASVSGVKLHLTYGARMGNSETYTAWSDKLKHKDAEILTPVLPGSWNPVSVVDPRILCMLSNSPARVP
jgi:hypothetical protein